MRLEKKPSTALSQQHEPGVKWNVHLGLAASQASTSGCLCVVVHDGVDLLAGRHGALDCVQEGDELLMTVALGTTAEHAALQRVQRREQGRGAVADIGEE